MQRLNETQIAFLSNHMEAMDKAYRTQIYFCFDNKENGAEAFDFLQRVYSDECNYNAWSGWFGTGDKRDFYLGFTTAQARDNVYNDIKNAKDQYQSTNQYQHEHLNENGGGTNGGTNTGSGTQKKDYTTYIIIGAALAVIVLLLLWKKK